MKIQFEDLKIGVDTSFKVMVNPRMSDFFFWHFHPEYEIIYIEGTDGTRHVGEHISKYESHDLVLIGPNIPHLNFDYGAKTNYEKTVIHLRENFMGVAFYDIPELDDLTKLFERSLHGVAFGEATKKVVAKRLKELIVLPSFEQFLALLQILKILAQSSDFDLLHTKPIKNQYNKREQERFRKLYEFIDKNHRRKIEISEVADFCNLTNAAFCRQFKKMTKLTFTQFLNHYRVNQAKKLLLLDKNVSETCFECGFESLSYFNRTFRKITNQNPLAFKKRYRQQ
jgi:AraC-like DNA-binding protein